MFGTLTLDAFLHGPIETGAQLIVLLGALGALGLLTYLRRWGWFYREWLTSVDHKKIGVMYLVLAFVMLLRGAMDAFMMRAQQALAVGDSVGYLSPEHYSQVFTAHGVIMIFFVAMPFMFGLLNFIVPLQIGSRDVAYPFLNSMSFWLTVAGAALINVSLVVGEFAATGWLAYPPLSELQYNPGVGVDYYIWALQVAGVGTLLSGVNFLATIIKMRAPGMTLMRMPIFIWTALGSMMLVIFAFPILTATLAMLSLDRIFGMHFFTTDLGGSAMMYINLIWAWGHPEVYILILPAFGIFSELVPVFAQKRLFGYTSMVVATMLIVVLSFVVWGHHFFTMGTSANVNAFFGIMTMAIAIPTGVKVFNWLFTMFRGRIIFATPMLWFMGFMVTFLLGGMTGVLMAIPGADFQLHNSLFLVAHFHNMIIGGVLFGFFAGFAYWFPKIFGFRLHERLGKWAFWAWISGFLLAFLPLYALGLMGMTRRLSQVDPSWHPLLLVAAAGACVIAVAIGLQVLQVIVSIRQRAQNIAGNDPWPGPAGGGRTLEWAVSSPPPAHNFDAIPHVYGRDAWWAAKEGGTDLVVQESEKEIEHPKNTSVGFFAAACALIVGFAIVWHLWWLAAVGVAAIATLLVVRSFVSEESIKKDTVTFGFWVYLMSDCVLFAGLFAAYAVLQGATFGGESISSMVDLPFVFVETMLLLTSSFTVGLALLAASHHKKRLALLALAATLALGLGFLWMELQEFAHLLGEGSGPSRSAFLSSFFTLLGVHGLHVALGCVWMVVVMAHIAFKKSAGSLRKLLCLSLFWHFLDLIWIFIFTVVYLVGALAV